MNTDDLIVSKVMDKRNICFNKNIQTSTKFLNGHELLLCLNSLKNEYNYVAFGGFLDAERQIILFYPDYIDVLDIEYPIDILKISLKQKMSHRDILGSLMGIGIKRETVGDILVFDDCAYVFCLKEITDYILSNLFKIGRQTVSIEKANVDEILNREEDFKIIKDTVASIRLDSVVSSGFLVSRNKASEYIKSSNVYVNNVICMKIDQKVEILDKISIRGKGKIVLNNILGKSKKDRIFIEIKKFV
ncbi:MAG: YlmH/Sll1252 family protein [Clostridia bacterium]